MSFSSPAGRRTLCSRSGGNDPVIIFALIFVVAPLDSCNYNEVGERGNRNNAILMSRLRAPLRSPAPSLCVLRTRGFDSKISFVFHGGAFCNGIRVSLL